MNKTITITSKGQTTLPAAIRHKLGISKSGGVLQISFNERKGELVIKKPVSVSELSERISRHIKPGTKPVENVGEYYQRSRNTN
ncbi:MAG TPA: AbrB/MazE/SpoVT family DNA-binding domain-containing protein [Candidatus Saccharimonadales bacterium]|nr:AbrB/MazE/SpoVT family DNA-binding domain-containing protein [Candidatus Saccharimonadales bacterium]